MAGWLGAPCGWLVGGCIACKVAPEGAAGVHTSAASYCHPLPLAWCSAVVSSMRRMYVSELHFTCMCCPAGVLTLGSLDVTLPPGQAAVSTTPNVCPSTCTQRFPGPLNVFHTFLHMCASACRWLVWLLHGPALILRLLHVGCLKLPRLRSCFEDLVISGQSKH